MTEPSSKPPEKSPETKRAVVPEAFPLGQPWPSGTEVFPGGIQLPLPNFPAAMVGFQQTQVWQGQFPPPDAVERYEAVLPGAFNRIITMAEKQQDAGIVQAKDANRYRHADVRRAHYLGAAVTVVALGCSLIAYHMGSAILGGAFLSVPVLSVGKSILDTVRPREAATSRLQNEKSDLDQKKLPKE